MSFRHTSVDLGLCDFAVQDHARIAAHALARWPHPSLSLGEAIGPQPVVERVIKGGWTIAAARYMDTANCPRWDVFAVYRTPVPSAPRIPPGPNPHNDPTRELDRLESMLLR